MTEILEAPQPRSVRKELDKVAVGRALMFALPKDIDGMNDVLEVHEASYSTERGGLVLVSPVTISRYAGKTILSKSQLQEAVDHLGPSAQRTLSILRTPIRLYPTNPDSISVDYYKVTAEMTHASDGRGKTRDPYFERNRLHDYLNIPHHRSNADFPIVFGTVKLPPGSPNAPALEECFNDFYARTLPVVGVQILDKR